RAERFPPSIITPLWFGRRGRRCCLPGNRMEAITICAIDVAHIGPCNEAGGMHTPSNAPRTNTAGLGRDIELLELLASDAAARAGGYGVTQLARLSGRSKTVVSRALQT